MHSYSFDAKCRRGSVATNPLPDAIHGDEGCVYGLSCVMKAARESRLEMVTQNTSVRYLLLATSGRVTTSKNRYGFRESPKSIHTYSSHGISPILLVPLQPARRLDRRIHEHLSITSLVSILQVVPCNNCCRWCSKSDWCAGRYIPSEPHYPRTTPWKSVVISTTSSTTPPSSHGLTAVPLTHAIHIDGTDLVHSSVPRTPCGGCDCLSAAVV